MDKFTKINPLSFDDWKYQYKRDVRVICFPDKLSDRKVKTKIITDKRIKIYLPKYTDGDFFDGNPVKATVGKGNYIVRIPAILTKDRRLIALDGVNRIETFKPKVIIVDYINISWEEEKYFADLLNINYNK